MRVSINLGFVTNSSSAIHHFPKEVLEYPKVRAFIKAFEIGEGFVSTDITYRSKCTTVAITKEQKQQILSQFDDREFLSAPHIGTTSDDIVILYGDEHVSIATALVDLICESLAEAKGGDAYDYRGHDELH